VIELYVLLLNHGPIFPLSGGFFKGSPTHPSVNPSWKCPLNGIVIPRVLVHFVFMLACQLTCAAITMHSKADIAELKGKRAIFLLMAVEQQLADLRVMKA